MVADSRKKNQIKYTSQSKRGELGEAVAIVKCKCKDKHSFFRELRGLSEQQLVGPPAPMLVVMVVLRANHYFE